MDLTGESTVRTRLSKLKQTGTVAAYHAKFRDIMLEATVQIPFRGLRLVATSELG